MSPEVLRLMSLGASEVAKMSRPSLAKAVNVLGKSVRASMQYFEKKGIMSPTYLQWEKAGRPTFATEGKTQGELQGIFKAARIFRKQETSTKAGFEKWESETELPPEPDARKQFWELFNDTVDDALAAGMTPSELKRLIAQMQDENPGMSSAELKDKLKRVISEKYEDYQREEMKNSRDSGDWWDWQAEDEEKTYNPGDIQF